MNNQAMSNHQLLDVGLDIIESLLGEDLEEEFSISTNNGVCKIRIPTHVSMTVLKDNPLVKAIEFRDSYTIITISEKETSELN